jgi:hypothetical protein
MAMWPWSLRDGHCFSSHFQFAAAPLRFELIFPAILQFPESASGHEN